MYYKNKTFNYIVSTYLRQHISVRFVSAVDFKYYLIVIIRHHPYPHPHPHPHPHYFFSESL